ncbi:MAG: hypothetical protein J1E96_00180 [Ruminococcus sp.]|nr:hypothetical protein [Ruminococcus sp.]
MKKLLLFLIVFAIICSGKISAGATSYDDLKEQYSADSILDELPDSAKNSLSDIGIDGIDFDSINNLTFEKIIGQIMNTAAEQSKTPLKIFATTIAIMLLYSILYSLKSSFENNSMQQVLSVCTTLCITCAAVIPVTEVITNGVNIIQTTAKFMLAFIPIIALIITASGRAASSASYYSIMIFAGQGVSQLSANVIAPFLKIFLGISVSSAISPSVNLSGFVQFISRLIKWLLGFIMTVFTAFLTIKQLISTGVDNVSTRAVRFTLTSLIPVVGSALSDAYRTVQSSVGLLKSGMGVFVIIAVAVMFLPILLECLCWMLTLSASKSVGEVLGLREPCFIFESVNTVVTTVFAILLCVMSVFIISTALILMLGGAGV